MWPAGEELVAVAVLADTVALPVPTCTSHAVPVAGGRCDGRLGGAALRCDSWRMSRPVPVWVDATSVQQVWVIA